MSWHDVVLQKSPKQEDFRDVANEVKKMLYATNGVLGAVLYGSLIWDRYNQRSDIDCVVVYNHAKRREVISILRLIRRKADNLHVPVEFYPIDDRLAQTQLHRVTPSFANHLSLAVSRDMAVKKDPLTLLTVRHISVEQEVTEYLLHKLADIEKDLVAFTTMNDEARCRFFKKVLESPIRVARKLLWYQDERVLSDDSEHAVSLHYCENANKHERELFERIARLNEQYTSVLVTQLHCPNERQYTKILKEIEDSSWDAHKFVRLIANRFKSVIV